MASSAKRKEAPDAALDDLIAELFPGQLKQQSSFDDPTPMKAQQPKVAAAPAHDADPLASNFDDEGCKGTQKSVTPQQGGSGATRNASEFDDSDDEAEGSVAKPLNPHVMVPFPDFPPQLIPGTCNGTGCVLSSTGNPAVFHPTVDSLRHIEQHDASLLHMTRATVMKMKGAIHATHPEAGNGVHPKCGCPFIVCRRCDHAVVRLQGARWLDGPDGSRDMYLSVRNYYPDWSRLAHCHGTHSEIAAKSSLGPLLAEAPDAAAYGCQCSWMTVTHPTFSVTTMAGEVAAAGPDGAKFRTTSAPCESQVDRRPPLWRCRGHLPVYL